jgi:hypothetical protein
VKYRIDLSIDGGQTWQPVVADWSIPRRGDEPGDVWSQSMCWGNAKLASDNVKSVRVRLHNTCRRNIARAEVHLVYRTPSKDATRVIFNWIDDSGLHERWHEFAPSGNPKWKISTGRKVQTEWVEMTPVAVNNRAE